MKTWEVIDRRTWLPRDTSSAIVMETVAAICATAEQAKEHVSQLMMAQADAEQYGLPRYEMSAYYIRRGTLLIGIEATATEQQRDCPRCRRWSVRVWPLHSRAR